MMLEIKIFPFLIDEICNGTIYNEKYYTKIGDREINYLFTYGVVKRKNNEDNPNSIIITDENYKYDVLVTVDSNDKLSMREIRSLNVDDLVRVRGILKWVNRDKTNQAEIMAEEITMMSMLDRSGFFYHVFGLRQDDVFKKETCSCLYNFLIEGNPTLALNDINENEFTIYKKTDKEHEDSFRDSFLNFSNSPLKRKRSTTINHSFDRRPCLFKGSNGELFTEIIDPDEN